MSFLSNARRAARLAFVGLLLAAQAALPALPPRQPGPDAPGAVILLSMRIRPYESLAGAMSKDLSGYRTRILVLDETGALALEIRRGEPKVIVAVGQEALRSALPYRNNTPLVFTMVLSPEEILKGKNPGVEGVAMIPSPRRQLAILGQGFHFKRVLLFYNPAVSGTLASHFREAPPAGIECRFEEMDSEASLLRRLKDGLKGYDAVLLLPDPTLLTEQSFRALVSSSYEAKVPLIGFSPLYLKLGAAISLSVPEGEIAKRAATLARLEEDTAADDLGGLHYPRACEIRTNPKAFSKLGLQLDVAALAPFGGVKEEQP